MRKVPGPPPDDRETESHRLAPHRPIRLASCRKDEDVGCGVEGRDLLLRQGPMCDDAADEVAPRKARPHARSVAFVGRLVAGEVERPRFSRKTRERLEELEDPFSWQPVGDREERGSAPVTEILRWTFAWRCDVSARGDDSNARLREPTFHELLRQVVACGEQDVRSP